GPGLRPPLPRRSARAQADDLPAPPVQPGDGAAAARAGRARVAGPRTPPGEARAGPVDDVGHLRPRHARHAVRPAAARRMARDRRRPRAVRAVAGVPPRDPPAPREVTPVAWPTAAPVRHTGGR